MQIDGLVTTIIPVFNRARRLREAVESVLTQDYDAIEIVIVDDGSTDETGAVADAFAEQYPKQVFVIHAPNGGRYTTTPNRRPLRQPHGPAKSCRKGCWVPISALAHSAFPHRIDPKCPATKTLRKLPVFAIRPSDGDGGIATGSPGLIFCLSNFGKLRSGPFSEVRQ